MNYYPHHIGDYDKSTAHLTACEDGIYCRLLRRYYDTEAPIPLDLKVVQRLVRARSKDELAAVETVLGEFFTRTEDGWRHGRCDDEIARCQDKRTKAKRSASARWKDSEKDADAMRTHSEGSPTAMRSHSEGNALQTPNTKEEAEARIRPALVTVPDDPEPEAQADHQAESAATAASDAVVERVLADYSGLLPDCQRVSVLTPKRRRLVLAADKLAKRFCRERELDYGAGFWRLFWAECAADEWLAGRKPNPNNPAWKQSIDVLLREDTIARVLDGVVSRQAVAA